MCSLGVCNTTLPRSVASIDLQNSAKLMTPSSSWSISSKMRALSSLRTSGLALRINPSTAFRSSAPLPCSSISLNTRSHSINLCASYLAQSPRRHSLFRCFLSLRGVPARWPQEWHTNQSRGLFSGSSYMLSMEMSLSDEHSDSSEQRDPLDAVSYTHLRAHETPEHLVCRLLLEKKKKKKKKK
eukprot:TRINITY_DN14909_c0_g1_i1.p1 TRINITY_DN14909_c0_g1~~TRINITY_DN14909_c0_g1_i1.p1  ORF type:complete len:184 (-),score=39.38 TRINITY_DN14909_c0_g1_i1:79-630(-)